MPDQTSLRLLADDGRQTAVTITDLNGDGFHDELVDTITELYEDDDRVIIER